MGQLTISAGNAPGTALQTLLDCDDIVPGSQPSYNTCKQIYAYHPMGAKIVDFPIMMAQSQPRRISVPNGPENRLVEAFNKEWKALEATKLAANHARLAMIYGSASIACLVKDQPSAEPLEFAKIWDQAISFNCYDPLNTAGSLVLNQDPNAIDFQKHIGIKVSGQDYHRSRTVTLFNEEPLYIEYTASAFGFVGRSVYQRVLYLLKSYLNTLVTDDMISTKAGVLITKVKQQSSVIDQAMALVGLQKRQFVKEAKVGNVIQIAVEEAVESLNLQNLDRAYGQARKNIIENIATGSGRPAKLLLAESFAEGFGEGTEDAKHIAQFIQGVREWMEPTYTWLDKIVRYRAWNPEFYKTIQKEFPEKYGDVPYTQAFYEWSNDFSATWPSLIEEPESEKIKVEDVKFKAMIALLEVVAPMAPGEEKARLIQWIADEMNSLKNLFAARLELDWDAIATYEPPLPGAAGASAGGEAGPKEPEAPPPFSQRDSLAAYEDAVARLPLSPRERRTLRLADHREREPETA